MATTDSSFQRLMLHPPDLAIQPTLTESDLGKAGDQTQSLRGIPEALVVYKTKHEWKDTCGTSGYLAKYSLAHTTSQEMDTR